MVKKTERIEELVEVGQMVVVKKPRVRGTIYNRSTNLDGVVMYGITVEGGREKLTMTRKNFEVVAPTAPAGEDAELRKG